MLYETVWEYIGDIHDMTVFDLFSGDRDDQPGAGSGGEAGGRCGDCRRSDGGGKENAARNGIFQL